jgi:hypothetical protein
MLLDDDDRLTGKLVRLVLLPIAGVSLTGALFIATSFGRLNENLVNQTTLLAETMTEVREIRSTQDRTEERLDRSSERLRSLEIIVERLTTLEEQR